MGTFNVSRRSPELGVRASHASPVIIATDGRAQSDSALVVGQLLAGDAGAARIVTVLKTMPILPDGQVPVSADLEASRRAAARREVISQVARTGLDETEVELR